MEPENKKVNPWNIVITLILLAFVAYVLVKVDSRREAAIVDPNEDNDLAQVEMSHCGLTVSSPLSNTLVSFPLSVSAIVDNTDMTNLGCGWTVFEAQAGTIKVLDINNQVVGSGILTTTQDWMTTSPVAYTSTVTLTGVPASNNLTLVFTEDDPSDMGNVDTLSVPVIKQ